jgi:hypothetical protein
MVDEAGALVGFHLPLIYLRWIWREWVVGVRE